ncbi:hypothetical protein V8C35DRAFT_303461 [Trichoderma chlorosporum]
MSNSPPTDRRPATVLEAADAELSRGSAQVNLVEEEDCDLKAPAFDRWKDYTFGSNFYFLNNGFTVELTTRRGCARTEVESLKLVSVRLSIYRIFRAELNWLREAQFKAGLFEKSVEVSVEAVLFGQHVQVGNSRVRQQERGNRMEMKNFNFQSRISPNMLGAQLAIPDMGLNFEVAKHKESRFEAAAAQTGNTGSHSGDGVYAAKQTTQMRMDMSGLVSREVSSLKTVEYSTAGGVVSGKKKVTSAKESNTMVDLKGAMGLAPSTRPALTHNVSTTHSITEEPENSATEEPKTVEKGGGGGDVPLEEEKHAAVEKTVTILDPTQSKALVPVTRPLPAYRFSSSQMSKTEAEQDPTAEPSSEKQPSKREAEAKQPKHFVVIGIFSPSTGIPDERVIIIDDPKNLFSSLSWGIFMLRGFRGLISLKHVTGFSVYKCDPFTPKHTRQRLNGGGKQIMAQLYHTYRLWSPNDKDIQQWMDWIHKELNHHYYTPEFDANNDPHEHKMLSLELVLGWSIFRLSFVVLAPVLLSLGIGLWLNSKAWTDPTSIQTAWSVASYIATAGAFLAAVLGFISNVSDK